MTERQALFFHLLLNKYHPSDRGEVVSYLPDDVKSSIRELKGNWNDPKVLLKSPVAKLRNIHYSWIYPTVKEYPELLRPFVAEALPEPSNIRLLSLLKSPRAPIATSFARQYLLNDLAKKMGLEKLTPIEHLPPSLLSFTLELTKEELIELIDFLGLYDLAEEIRRIVDKNQLKKIYNCLSIKKQHFLRSCLLSKEKIVTPKLELEKWNGEQDILEKLLHKRGLVRFGKALSGQTADFIWYIVHKMDSGRGVLLSKYINSTEIPGITPLMIQEIQTVHNFFKKMGAS